MTGEYFERVLGRKGGEIVTGTSTKTGPWCALTALADTVIADLTPDASAPITGSGTAIALPLGKGITIYGRFTSFKLTSGTVIAYRD